ncbi:MAG TPA: head GIN domain-containing protein [Chitinophaga sp.]|uniref:head GIN domain-containing protein n=1 Tax=Chitinophaga sp. TaxID=1869181 RepID=UPI002D12CD66|nr:head GIN domain-containing protein [Chitinophaga sp.]HVI45544.1 head GIN domain-containing protein [Chitinophaga sp.]
MKKKQVVITYTSLSVGWLLLMLVIFSLILGSCTKEKLSGSGNVIAVKRSISPFTDVEISGPFEVHLAQDLSGLVEIMAEDNIIDAVETDTRRNTLCIRIKKDVELSRHMPIQVYVHSRIFQRIAFYGTGDLYSKDTLLCPLLTYEQNGSGDASLLLSSGTLKTTINGSGNIFIKGHSDTIDSDINGNGAVYGTEMSVQRADITIRGTGGHSLHVDKLLNVGIYGSGNVTYSGNPELHSEIRGTGRLIKI